MQQAVSTSIVTSTGITANSVHRLSLVAYCVITVVIFRFFSLSSKAGKVSIHLKDMGHPDMVTIVGHKIGAPKVSPNRI